MTLQLAESDSKEKSFSPTAYSTFCIRVISIYSQPRVRVVML